MNFSRDKTGDVSHVNHEDRSHFGGNGRKAGKIDEAGIGARSGYDHPRAMFLRETFHRFVVNGLRLWSNAISDDTIELPSEVQRVSMRQMPARLQTHGQHGVSGVHEGKKGGHVRLRPRMGCTFACSAPKRSQAGVSPPLRRFPRTRSHRNISCADILLHICSSVSIPGLRESPTEQNLRRNDSMPSRCRANSDDTRP